MTEAPERIWATTGLYYDYVQDWSEGQWQDDAENAIGTGDDETVVQYIRADHVDALIAAAYDAAARAAFRAGKSVHSGYRDENERFAQRIENELRLEVQAAIRGARKQGPQETLDALLKAERERALREAAEAVVDLRMQNQGIVMQWNEAIDEASDRIEALISEDATDG